MNTVMKISSCAGNGITSATKTVNAAIAFAMGGFPADLAIAKDTESQWQIVVIAPRKFWHGGLARWHWASQKIGQRVRVSVQAVDSRNMGCSCELHELHPEDVTTITGDLFDGCNSLDAAMCQIL